jgi:polyferredoxin
MKVQRIRLIVQFLAFAILVYGGWVGIDLGSNLPTFACAYVRSSRGGVCFYMPFQHMLGLPFKAFKGWFGIRFIKAIITFVLLVILLNKTWCGWVCPMGLIQDLLTRLRKFLRIDQVRFFWMTHDNLKSVKYILLFLMIIIPIGIGNSFFGLPKLSHDLAAPFCQICPARILLPIFNGDLSQIFIDFSSYSKIVLTFLGMLLTGLLLVGSFMKRRFLCAFCPMSALMSLMENAGLIQLKKVSQRCTKCGNCQRVCDMEIRDVYEEREREKLVTQDCMLCLKCIEVCPEDKALKATFMGKPIFTSSIEGFLKRQDTFEKYETDKE